MTAQRALQAVSTAPRVSSATSMASPTRVPTSGSALERITQSAAVPSVVETEMVPVKSELTW